MKLRDEEFSSGQTVGSDEQHSHAMEMDLEATVLIVGAGPAGLLLAYLLAEQGVQTLAVEKYPKRLAAPKAHALSPRSLEVCRQYGIDTAALRRLGTPRSEAQWVNFCTTLNRPRIGRLPYERMDVEVLKDTPEMIHNIPQPAFEAYVADLLIDSPKSTIRKGLAFVSCSQDSTGVTSVLTERDTGRLLKVRSKYVVGCDGARSAVRSSLGVECDGEVSVEAMMTIHFRADITGVIKDKVGMLHWCTDPAVSGFIIAYDPRGDMVLISNFDAKRDPLDSWTEEKGRETVLAAIGCSVPVEVLSCRPWILSRKVAQQYRVGRVFLAGDAAHSFPPTGGLGLNCGLADVHNLAWKLASVVQGTAGDSLLDTYQSERKPVADIYSQQSASNGKRIFSFLKQLGTAGIEDLKTARANLYSTVNDPSQQHAIAEGVEDQREHFDNLELHIGYVYGSRETPHHASKYAPKFEPGARLPHAWIQTSDTLSLPALDLSYVHELSKSDREAMEYSILDLCRPMAFTLIVLDGDSETQVQGQQASQRLLSTHNIELNVLSSPKDFSLSSSDQIQRWPSSILVRPDQHILTCFKEKTNSEMIEQAVGECLGLVTHSQGLIHT